MIKDKKVLRKLDVAFGILLLIGSVILLVWSALMPVSGLGGAMQVSFWIAPGALPVVVSSVMAILAVVLIAGAVREGAKVTGEDVRKALAILGTREAKYSFVISALLILYIVFMLGWLPYWLATFLFLSVFMFIFKAGRPHVILLVSAFTTLAIWYCFGEVVMIPLP